MQHYSKAAPIETLTFVVTRAAYDPQAMLQNAVLFSSDIVKQHFNEKYPHMQAVLGDLFTAVL